MEVWTAASEECSTCGQFRRTTCGFMMMACQVMHVLCRGKTLHYTGAFVVYVESLCMGTINDLIIYPYVGSSFRAAGCFIAFSYNLKMINY